MVRVLKLSWGKLQFKRWFLALVLVIPWVAGVYGIYSHGIIELISIKAEVSIRPLTPHTHVLCNFLYGRGRVTTRMTRRTTTAMPLNGTGHVKQQHPHSASTFQIAALHSTWTTSNK